MPDHPIHTVGWQALRNLAGAVFIIIALASCRMNGAAFLTPEEKSWLNAHQGQLEVLLEAEAPPYAFHDDDGTFNGFFLDYLRELETILGFRFSIRKFSQWNDLLTYSKTHNNFIILNVSRTEDRAQYLLFTDAVIKVPYAIVTRKTSDAKTIPEFADKTLCTVRGYAVIDALTRDYPHVPLTDVKNSVTGFHAVFDGTCDAMVINQMEASYLIDNLGLSNLHIAGQTLFLNRLAAATSHQDPVLFAILEKAVDKITPRRRQEIYRQWVSTGHIGLPFSILLIIEIGGGLILCIIFLLWAWSTSLRKQVDSQTRQIRQSRENLRITLLSIGDGVMATDTEGKVTRLNPVAMTLTGWAFSEAQGKSMAHVFKLQDIRTHQPIPPSDLTGCQKYGKETATNEAILISRNDETYRIHYSVSPIRDEAHNTTGTVFVFRDITNNIKAEEERLRFKKMESLGILAGGIAHDFNNLLTGLYGNISMAKMTLPPEHEAMSYIMSAEESMEAAVALTSQFLTFSKDEKPDRKIIDLGKTLVDAASFAAHGLNTKLETAIDEDLWPVSADKGQLSQIVGNLIINAHQAMATGGIITLTAKNIHDPSDRHVSISVQDQGTGIAPENLDKIFDPYFTTKKTGSGLGLATTYAIITKHNGTIQVESQLGKGSTFTITLPAAAESLEDPVKDRLEELIDTQSLEAHILVLDDQAVIRKILETILTKLGFEVTFTVEGNETVEAYQNRLNEGKPFDAVVLDLTIPGGMGGKEASEKILAMDPDAKLIISSGHASDPIMSNYKDHGIKAIAVKPYRFDDFKEILLRVLLDKY
ncbi:hypothetical protein DSLASN_23590 [Desulfoluna limicola]|uniref:histidine kinase n=1 Tax=Desulfoluna limicola TaxID=2810562 RepID=A0ABM7PI24_9BACT|nr:transporter substrate-binding domain-containing protein [Desulfoluna limicola]BCS96727.1 hypothetical protein DSLASN_23590 [Desulfoluna limicola]